MCYGHAQWTEAIAVVKRTAGLLLGCSRMQWRHRILLLLLLLLLLLMVVLVVVRSSRCVDVDDDDGVPPAATSVCRHSKSQDSLDRQKLQASVTDDSWP